jgi:hypothetical protein
MGLFLLLVCQWSIVTTFAWIIEDLISLYDGEELSYAWEYSMMVSLISFLIIYFRVRS